ncbi:hypothetical protein E3155_14585 [Escherichia coli O55:H7]|nr:hypothetical protein E3155_14585 [Escherichia coli O55:H7]
MRRHCIQCANRIVIAETFPKKTPDINTRNTHYSFNSFFCQRGINGIATRYFIRTPYNGVLASQTRHDYCPQSSMIRGVMSPGLVGRW